MAASIGELFIQLGVDADIKPLDDAIKKMREVVKGINEEVKANKRLLKYLNDINNARTEAQKKIIKENFVKELQIEKQEKEIEAAEKAKEEKLKQIAAIKGAIKGIVGFVAAISGAVYALNKLTDSLVQNNQEFLNLTRNSDIALSTFQKWDAVGRMFGVRGAANQIANLNQRLYELKLTGQGAEGFMFAGINPMGQSAESVMEQLRNRVAGLDDTSATFLLNKMGIDPSMLHLLRLGRKEFEELGRTIEKYQLTDKQRGDIQAMNAQLEIARIKLQYVKDRAILALMPYVVKLMNLITKAADLLRNKVVQNTLKAIGVFAAWIGLVKGLTVAFKLLGGAITIVRTALTLLTAHPIIAAITAILGVIMLLIDDINHFYNGGGSVIGVIAKALEDFQKNGIFGDDVPKWIQILAMTADKLLKFKEWKDENIGKTQEYITHLPEVKTQKEFDTLFRNSAPQWMKKIKNWGDSLFEPNILTPSVNGINRNLDNSRNINKSQTTTVYMDNNFNTSQPAQDVYRELIYLNNAYAPNY